MVAKNTSTSTSNYFVQGLGSTLSEGTAANTARQYYLYDGTGNVRFVTDNTGAKLQYLSYDPYGNPLSVNGTNTFQYKGEQTDQGSMYFMRARYYDPTTGRFTSRDPLAGKLNNPQSQNGYNFANANPVNLSDPSGKQVAISPNTGAVLGGIAAACTLPVSGTALVVGGLVIGGVIVGSILLDQAQNPAQDKKLTEGEIKRLQEGGEDIEGLKKYVEGGPSKGDLYKKPDGEVVVKPKNGAGDGETTGLNIKDY